MDLLTVLVVGVGVGFGVGAGAGADVLLLGRVQVVRGLGSRRIVGSWIRAIRALLAGEYPCPSPLVDRVALSDGAEKRPVMAMRLQCFGGKVRWKKQQRVAPTPHIALLSSGKSTPFFFFFY